VSIHLSLVAILGVGLLIVGTVIILVLGRKE